MHPVRLLAALLALLLVGALAPACATTGAGTASCPTCGDDVVVLRHGPMTYVMDIVPNQIEKAQAMLARCDLAMQVEGHGGRVAFEVDETLGDTVIVLMGGEELGRAEMMDLERDPAPVAIMQAIKSRL